MPDKELIHIENDVIKAQEKVIQTGDDLIEAYKELTALLLEKEEIQK